KMELSDQQQKKSSSISPILEKHRPLFQESILRDCQRILRDVPATS
ncbi:13672_t:CDS:1, partial [Ambispora leptoticha]